MRMTIASWAAVGVAAVVACGVLDYYGSEREQHVAVATHYTYSKSAAIALEACEHEVARKRTFDTDDIIDEHVQHDSGFYRVSFAYLVHGALLSAACDYRDDGSGVLQLVRSAIA